MTQTKYNVLFSILQNMRITYPTYSKQKINTQMIKEKKKIDFMII
jgi:hypothetical protein